MDKQFLMWGVFGIIISILLILDLGFFSKKNKNDFSSSVRMTIFYMCISCLFGVFVWFEMGFQSTCEYFTAFFVEKTLSLDNVFLMSVVFSSLQIPLHYHHRVLFFGILGVIVLRAIAIALGVELLHQFSWILYVFAIIMIFTGIKMWIVPEKTVDITENRFLKWVSKCFRVTQTLEGQKFIIKKIDPCTQKIHYFITPLFVALLCIEFADIVFAFDSIPAIFSITSDPYIIYTSNIFAILGLRSLYFVLSSMMEAFHYLRYALAFILVFIGSKIFAMPLLGIEKIPASLSLGVVVLSLALGCACSLLRIKKNADAT